MKPTIKVIPNRNFFAGVINGEPTTLKRGEEIELPEQNANYFLAEGWVRKVVTTVVNDSDPVKLRKVADKIKGDFEKAKETAEKATEPKAKETAEKKAKELEEKFIEADAKATEAEQSENK